MPLDRRDDGRVDVKPGPGIGGDGVSGPGNSSIAPANLDLGKTHIVGCSVRTEESGVGSSSVVAVVRNS